MTVKGACGWCCEIFAADGVHRQSDAGREWAFVQMDSGLVGVVFDGGHVDHCDGCPSPNYESERLDIRFFQSGLQRPCGLRSAGLPH